MILSIMTTTPSVTAKNEALHPLQHSAVFGRKLKNKPQRDTKESEDKEMSKIQNKLKVKKFSSIDKVARRTIKAQKEFDKTDEQKRRDDYERDVPQSSFDQMP